MREIKRESLIDVSEFLLFDILQELKILNSYLKPTGKENTNVGDMLLCARKHKKEGVNNVV